MFFLFSALEETEDMMISDRQKLQREIEQIEKAVAERISYLERYKTVAKFKLGWYFGWRSSNCIILKQQLFHYFYLQNLRFCPN